MRVALLNLSGQVWAHRDVTPEQAAALGESLRTAERPSGSIVALTDEAPVPELGQRYDPKAMGFVDDKAFLTAKAAELADVAATLEQQKLLAERDHSRITQAQDALPFEVQRSAALVAECTDAHTAAMAEAAEVAAKAEAAKLLEGEPIEGALEGGKLKG